MSKTTDLTRLLAESRPARDKLVASRDYEGAKKLRENCFKTAEERKAAVQRDIGQRHEMERRRLGTARQMALAQAHTNVDRRVDSLQQDWSKKLDLLRSNHAESLQMFEDRTKTREKQRPVVLSNYVRQLQRSEKRLADLHQYDEAELAKRKIAHMEVDEMQRVEQDLSDRVGRRVSTLRNLYEEEERAFLSKMRNTVRIATFRGEQEEQRTLSKFDHTQRDMLHAQKRELQQNPLLSAYMRPPKLAAQHKARPGTSELAGVAAMRGTTYLRQLKGSRFDIPSLCDMYGDRLGKPSSSSVDEPSVRLS